MKIWKTLSTKIIDKNPWTEYRMDEFEIPEKTNGNYYYMQSPGSVSIVAVNGEGKILLLKMYRYLAERFGLEFPGGGVKPGQTNEEAARAEFAEEFQLEAGRMQFVATVFPLAGLVKEEEHVFVAMDLKPIEGHHQDETEEFEGEWLALEELEQAIGDGRIFNGHELSAWAVARPHVLRIVDEIRSSK